MPHSHVCEHHLSPTIEQAIIGFAAAVCSYFWVFHVDMRHSREESERETALRARWSLAKSTMFPHSLSLP
jgi:hypothetical protein